MGLPFSYLYLSKAKNYKHLFLTGDYKPVLTDKGVLMYPESFRNEEGFMEVPIGHDMYIPNIMGWVDSHEPVTVEVIRSKEDTGIWASCANGYFSGEVWIYTAKPEYIKEGKRGSKVRSSEDKLNGGIGLHIGGSSLQMKLGEGPIPVTFRIVNNKQKYNEHE